MLKKIASEDYIKTITSLSLNSDIRIIRITEVAKKLKVSIAAVSDMVKKLVKEGFLVNHAYKGVELTDKGVSMGLRLIRNHRLWEVFLHQVLKMSLEDIHDEAEFLEHAASGKLIERIDAYLGYPTSDPHGNPIPTLTGEIVFRKDEISLLDASENASYWIRRFGGLDTNYLQYISLKGVTIGKSLKVNQRFNDSLVCDVEGQEIVFTIESAKKIFVAKQS